MRKCIKCGKILWTYNDENKSYGMCDRCIENEKELDKKRELVRKKNYQLFLAHGSTAGNQRIFDGFIKKYPDALITGVSVIEADKKLLFYLDGQPMYYATFNPLTNSVDLVSYQEVQARLSADKEKNAKEAAEANKQKELAQNSGCAVWLSVFGIFYGLFCILFSTIGGAIGTICSLLVIAGGLAKSRSLVIVGGALSISAALFGFPFTIGFVLFGIFYICAGTSM